MEIEDYKKHWFIYCLHFLDSDEISKQKRAHYQSNLCNYELKCCSVCESLIEELFLGN